MTELKLGPLAGWKLGGAAIAVLVVIGLAGAGGALLVGHQPAAEPTAAVVPGVNQGSTQVGGQPGGEAAGTAANAAQPAPGVAADGSYRAVPNNAYPVIFPPCPAGPTVQFQGRGIAATGFARIEPAGTGPSYVYLNLQVQGPDVNSVSSGIQDRIKAVTGALEGAGIAAGNIKVLSLGVSSSVSYGAANRQAYASASIQALAASPEQQAKALAAAVVVEGVSGYSNQGLPDQPTADQRKAAVADATGQARDMAESAAKAAGVTLGQLQDLAIQPPSACGYGAGGPQLLIQVTATYAIK